MKPTKDELTRAIAELEDCVACTPSGGSALRVVVAALEASYDGAVLAEYNGKPDEHEWVTVSTWLYPGEKVVVQSAE